MKIDVRVRNNIVLRIVNIEPFYDCLNTKLLRKGDILIQIQGNRRVVRFKVYTWMDHRWILSQSRTYIKPY